MAIETTKVLAPDQRDSGSVEQIEHEKKTARKMISIWFFVGCLFTVYGVLILFAGLTKGSGREVAMSNLHAQIWWGIGLLVIGLVYIGIFRPKR
jgi:predicted nucleic acid-binding Zn ribbon protein